MLIIIIIMLIDQPFSGGQVLIFPRYNKCCRIGYSGEGSSARRFFFNFVDKDIFLLFF